ncbi:MAG: glycosyltransferase family 4 protein [Candidatus Diapherotrites archaeon]|nr:glycosyltransferase family 4 protein [Candidatus Diapherotrites archaeon]
MKVLWLKPTNPPNVSIGRYRIAEQLEKRGHKVTIEKVSGLGFFRGFLKWIGGDYDVIVGTVRSGTILAFFLGKLRGKPYIADITDPFSQYHRHGVLRVMAVRFLEETAVLNADETIFIYENYMKELKRKGATGVKLDNGVNYEKMARPSSKSVAAAKKILEKSGVDTKKPIVFYMGGLQKQYHIKETVEAAKKVKAEFVFVGSGPEEKWLVGENVYYLGSFKQDLIPGFLYHSSVCLCLVDAEQPLKVLEYGAAGIPIVALKGALEKRFSEKDMFFTDASPLAIAKTITKALEPGAKKRAVLLKKKYKRYDWSIIAGRYDKIIRRVIK